jgi:hypothetical protein
MLKDRVVEAIAIIEYSRSTHVEWSRYITNYPEEAAKVIPTVEVAGDVAHHQRCIEGYDKVIAVLKEMLDA